MQRRPWLLAGLGWAASPRVSAEGVVRLARPHFFREVRHWYPYQLLQAALQAAGDRRTVLPVDRMTDARALIELGSEQGQVDVVVNMNAPDREARFRLVPAPIYRGLFGWRLLAVRGGDAERLGPLRQLQDLQAIRLGQGSDWPDTAVLQANALNVHTETSIGHLYEALRAGRIDAFPRSVTEIWNELPLVGGNFEVLPQVALHYHRDLFFHLRPENTELAEVIERGIRRMHRSGDWLRLLQHHVREPLDKSALGKRRVIALRTPGLSPALQRIPAAWWQPS